MNVLVDVIVKKANDTLYSNMARNAVYNTALFLLLLAILNVYGIALIFNINPTLSIT